MTRSSATNTLSAYVSQPTPQAHARALAGRVADQLDTIAVPPELHHAVEALDAAGVLQRDRVAGGRGLVDAVEPIGVRNAGRDELAEVEQHSARIRVIRVGVGLD